MRCDKKFIYLLVGITIAFAFYILVEFAVEQHAPQHLTNVYNDVEQQERVRGSDDVETRSIDAIITGASRRICQEFSRSIQTRSSCIQSCNSRSNRYYGQCMVLFDVGWS